MQNTLILVTTHRGMNDDTYECVLGTGCPNILKVKGLACVDRARCTAFDRALEAFASGDKAGLALDTVLCVDDDMLFSAADAQRLVDLSRSATVPVSARYVTRGGKLCGRQLTDDQITRSGHFNFTTQDRWMTGLGFLAVQRRSLEARASELPRLSELRLWAKTGEHPVFPREWLSEDFWFCLQFGGVELSSIEVGHQKTVALYPGRDGGIRVVMPEARSI